MTEEAEPRGPPVWTVAVVVGLVLASLVGLFAVADWHAANSAEVASADYDEDGPVTGVGKRGDAIGIHLNESVTNIDSYYVYTPDGEPYRRGEYVVFPGQPAVHAFGAEDNGGLFASIQPGEWRVVFVDRNDEPVATVRITIREKNPWPALGL